MSKVLTARNAAAVALGALLVVGLYLTSLYSYLLFHALAELFSIVIAWGIFVIAWNARRFMDNEYLLVIGIAYLFVGGLDLLHTLAYKGMGVFGEYGANLPTQLWIASRYLASLSFLAASLFLNQRLDGRRLLAGYALLTALLLAAIFAGFFPACYVEGQGLTTFKVVSEYIISLLFAAALVVLWRQRRHFDRQVWQVLVGSILLAIGAELAFSFYVGVYDLSNLVGHLLKLLSFYLIYKAIIETGLTRPYDLLFRDLARSEESLRQQNRFLNDVFEALAHPFYVVGADDYVIQMANSAAWNGQAAEGMTCYALTHRLDSPCNEADHPCPLRLAKVTGKPVVVEHVHYDRHGSPRHMEVRGYPILDDEGRVVRLIEYSLDITERKLAEQIVAQQARELARSNKELEEFAYIASHDLQEPLRKIRAFGQRLEAKYADRLDEPGQDYINRMQAATDRMQTLIENLLQYSRVTTQARPFERVDLAQVARDVLVDLEVRVAQVGGQVVLADLPVIEADSLQMRQLLQNLIGNGLKFHRPAVPPVVRVEASIVPAREVPELDDPTGRALCRLTVADNGIGFDEKYLERIFKPFQRLHGRDAYEGSGMGLAICRKIAERHGGRITAHSAPDRGATFVVTLPAGQESGRGK